MNPGVGGGVDDAPTDLNGLSFVASDITGTRSTAATVPTLTGPAKSEYPAHQVVPCTNLASPAPSVVSIPSPASASSSPSSTTSPQVFQSQSASLVTNGMGHVVDIPNTSTPITSAANDAIITDGLLPHNILSNSTIDKALTQTHIDTILSSSTPPSNSVDSSLASSLQGSVEDGLSLGLDEGARLIMTSDTVSQQQQAQTTRPHAKHSHSHSHSIHSTHSPQSSHSPHAPLGTPPLQQVAGTPVLPSQSFLSQTSPHSLAIMHQMANFPIDPSVVSASVPVSASGPMPVQAGPISRHGHAHTTSTSSLASALDEPQTASLTIPTHVQTQSPSNLTSIGMSVGNIGSGDISMDMLGSSIGTVSNPLIGLSGIPFTSGATGHLVDGSVFSLSTGPTGPTTAGDNLLTGFDRSRSGSLSVASPGSGGAVPSNTGMRGSASFSPTDFPLIGTTPPSNSPSLHLPHSQASPGDELNTAGTDAHITVLDNMLSDIAKAAQSARTACATGHGLEANYKIDEMKRAIALVSNLLQATFLDGNHNDRSGSSASPPASDLGSAQMNQGGSSSMMLDSAGSMTRSQQLSAHLQRVAPGIIPNFAQISSVHAQLNDAAHSAPISMPQSSSNSLGAELHSLLQLPLSADAAFIPSRVMNLDVDQDMDLMGPIPQVAMMRSNIGVLDDYNDCELDPDGSRKRCASTTGDRIFKALKREPTEEPPQVPPPLMGSGSAMSVDLTLKIPLQPDFSPPYHPLPSPGAGALNSGSLSLPMSAPPPPSVSMNGSSLPSSRPGSSSGVPHAWPPLTHPSLPHAHTYPRTVTMSVTRSGSVSSLPSLSVSSPSTIMGPPSHPASATPLSPVGPAPGFTGLANPMGVGANETVQNTNQAPLGNPVQSYLMDSTQGPPHGIMYPPQGFPQTNPNATAPRVGRTSRSSSFSNPFAFGMGMDNSLAVPPAVGPSNPTGQRLSPPMNRSESQVRVTRSRASSETGGSLRGSFNSTSRSSSRGGHDSEGDNGITTSINRSHRQQHSLGQISGSSSASVRSRASSRDTSSQDLNSTSETVVPAQLQQNGSVAANSKEGDKSSSSTDSSSPGGAGNGGPGNEIPAEYRGDIDRIFINFLQNLCSNLQARDPKGDNIHQTLMAKKMQRLDESPDFRPFKFRIQAFTNTFLSELAKKGYPEEKLPMKKIRHYLWSQPYIIRYTEIGKKAKSKGNHIWVVEARKLADGVWEFRPQSRKICGAPPGVAYVGVRWTWVPHVWDPQAPKMTTPIQYSSPSLPAWLSWDNNGVLSGTPPADAADCDITVDARFNLAGRQHKLTESVRITIAPMTSVNDISFASSRRPSLSADSRRVNSDPVVSQTNGVNSRSVSQRSSASKMLQVLTTAAGRVAQEAQAHVISARSPSDPPGHQLQSLAKQQHVLTVTAQAMDHAAARTDLSPNTLVVAAQQVIMHAARHVQEDKEVTAVMFIRAGEFPPVPSQVTVDEVSLATQSAVAHAVELTGPLSSEVDVMITASSLLQQGPRMMPEAPSMTPPLDFPRSHSAGAIQNSSYPLNPPSDSSSQAPSFPPSASVPSNLTRSDFSHS